MRLLLSKALLVLVLVLGMGWSGLRAAEVVVFAAASLSEALRDIGSEYQKELEV